MVELRVDFFMFDRMKYGFSGWKNNLYFYTMLDYRL